MDSKRTKRIFVSDIHMGDKDSIIHTGDSKPYGWLLEDRAAMFAEFLKLKMKDVEVRQIIILGDLFDEWVCPANKKPIDKNSRDQYKKIATAPQNRGIISALKQIAISGDIELIYVPGNHDMLMTKDILSEIIPGIKYNQRLYLEDGIVAEHGSDYCLFNAPDPFNNEGHILPLGYFITRAVAEKAARKGSFNDTITTIEESVSDILHNEKLGNIVLNTIVESSGMDKDSQIVMNGINGYGGSIKIGDIEKIFGNIYQLWNYQKPDNVPNEEALISDIGYLYPAALSRYLTKKEKPDIVIFGHTHRHELHSIPLPEFSSEKECHLFPSRHIYANCGTWINGKECTIVETEIKNNKHYIRVMKYEKSQNGTTIKKIDERHKNI